MFLIEFCEENLSRMLSGSWLRCDGIPDTSTSLSMIVGRIDHAKEKWRTQPTTKAGRQPNVAAANSSVWSRSKHTHTHKQHVDWRHRFAQYKFWSWQLAKPTRTRKIQGKWIEEKEKREWVGPEENWSTDRNTVINRLQQRNIDCGTANISQWLRPAGGFPIRPFTASAS